MRFFWLFKPILFHAWSHSQFENQKFKFISRHQICSQILFLAVEPWLKIFRPSAQKKEFSKRHTSRLTKNAKNYWALNCQKNKSAKNSKNFWKEGYFLYFSASWENFSKNIGYFEISYMKMSTATKMPKTSKTFEKTQKFESFLSVAKKSEFLQKI